MHPGDEMYMQKSDSSGLGLKCFQVFENSGNKGTTISAIRAKISPRNYSESLASYSSEEYLDDTVKHHAEDIMLGENKSTEGYFLYEPLSLNDISWHAGWYCVEFDFQYDMTSTWFNSNELEIVKQVYFFTCQTMT